VPETLSFSGVRCWGSRSEMDESCVTSKTVLKRLLPVLFYSVL